MTFYAKTEEYDKIPRVMINPLNFTDYWRPKDFKSSKVSKVFAKERDKLSFMIEIPYGDNMGHNILDNLYPIYLKLFLLKLSPDSSFDIYSNQRIYSNLPNPIKRSFIIRSQSVFATFAKGDLYDLDPVVGNSKLYDKLILVKTLYAGCGRMGARYINQNNRLFGVTDFNLVPKFRDRFYDTYEVDKSVPRDLIMIVDNKRYEKNKEQFLRLIEVLRNKYPKYKAEFVSFRKYSFRNQLKLMARTVLYVSGPGTAMTNHIFLQDRTFLYNIGDILDGRYDRYMEEYLAESMPLVQPFYYFENAQAKTLNFNLIGRNICDIIENHILTNNFTRNATEHGSGLSFIGKKFIHYCGMFQDFCDSYIHYMYSERRYGDYCAAYCAWEEMILRNSCNSNNNKCPYPYKFPFKCDDEYNCKIT